MPQGPIDPEQIAETIERGGSASYAGLDDRELDAAIDAQRRRRDRARAKLAAADAELGRIFSVVIGEKRDLKAKALRAGVSRQTAYTLAERAAGEG